MTMNNWVKTFYGKATDYDKVSGVQCVDVAKTFIKYVLGVEPIAVGNAIDYWKKRNTSSFLKSLFTSHPYTVGMKIQKGDVCVFTSKSGYGHICVATGEHDKNCFYSYDQNYPRAMHEPMTKIKHTYSSFLGVLRPKNQSNITPAKAVTYVTTTANLNAYSSSSYGKVALVIPKGKKLELVKKNAGTMTKYNKKWTMNIVKYNSKNYYVASYYLR